MTNMLPKRTLMGPGPSDGYPEVLAAMARPTICHLDPAFVAFMDELNELLRYALQTSNTVTLPISAPGSAGMECCLINLLEPGDEIVIATNGVFGGRMVEIARRCGATPICIDFEWGTPVDHNRWRTSSKLILRRLHLLLSIPKPLPVYVPMPRLYASWPVNTIA